MATKDQVIALHKQNPAMTARQIADALDCLEEYVRATAKRNNLILGAAYPRQQDAKYLRSEARRLMWRADKLVKRAIAIEARK